MGDKIANAAENGLMQQIDPQGLLAADAKEADDWIFFLDLGQQAGFALVEGLSQSRSYEEEA